MMIFVVCYVSQMFCEALSKWLILRECITLLLDRIHGQVKPLQKQI